MNNCVSISNLNPCVDNNNSLFDINNGSCCCVGIKPYCRNQCVCYNSCCCCPCPPIIPTGPMPPMPPIPPMPPMPPFVIGSIGQFQATPTGVLNNVPYIFNTVNIMGNAIEHVDGTSDIILAPNTLYEFSWEIISNSEQPGIFTYGAKLVLNGIDVPGSESLVTGEGNNDLIARANGMFMTGNMQSILNLVHLTDFIAGSLTSATLTIAELLP